MAAIDVNEVVGQILDVLREAFEGPKERWSYFTDNRSDAGLFGTLGRLAASDASRIRGKTSIAAMCGTSFSGWTHPPGGSREIGRRTTGMKAGARAAWMTRNGRACWTRSGSATRTCGGISSSMRAPARSRWAE